jgi:hypothetical protein
MALADTDTDGRKKLGLDSACLVVAAFGLVTPAKRIDVALRGFREILTQTPDALFVVVGEVSPDCDIEPLVDELGLRDVVRITGRVDKETLQHYLDACDVCVSLRNPTCGETSAVALRAMAAGKPLIVSDVGGFRELPGDCCIRVAVDEQEVANVAIALRYFADNPNKVRKMGASARRSIQDLHDPATIALDYVRFIEQAIQRTNGAISIAAPEGIPGSDQTGRRDVDSKAHVSTDTDVIEIVQRVRQQIRTTQLGDGAQEHLRALERSDGSTSLARILLNYHLQKAEEAGGDIFVEDQLRQPRSLIEVPISLLRQQLHSLVRFYLGRFTEKQASFNYLLVKALYGTIDEMDGSNVVRSDEGTADLKSSVAELRQRAERLESHIADLQSIAASRRKTAGKQAKR